MTWLKALVFLCLLLAGPMFRPAARTDSFRRQPAPIAVSRNEATVDFPDRVTFSLEVSPTAPLVSATLTYDVAQSACVEASTQVPVEARGNRLEWTWVMSRSGNPPPGAALWWEWTVTDTAGTTLTTPRQEVTLADERYNWRTVLAEGIQLHWYRGDEVGPVLLEAAVEGLARLENELGVELQDEVRLFIYGDSADMRAAVLYIQDWAGGVAFTDYNTILIGVPPNQAEGWGRRTVRHELAHLVIGQFGRSCVGGRRPTWLEEGLAVYAEGAPEEYLLEDIASAIGDDTLAPVRSLNGAFPAHGREAGIAYSQSYSLVAYLLERYGREPMQELLLTLAEGAGYDQALEQVYGFNADGLEVEWRAAIGAPPRDIRPTPTPLAAAAIPTYAPLDPPSVLPTPPSAAATAAPALVQDERPPGGCAVGLAPLLLLAAAAGWQKRARKSCTKDTQKTS